MEIEYTDAPSQENESASLSRSAEGKLETAEGKASDLVAAMLQVIPAGTITFSFSENNNGVMTYSVDGVSQSKPIVRQPF